MMQQINNLVTIDMLFISINFIVVHMAGPVATCAGSTGGAQPPHDHPLRLPAQCEAASDVPDIDEEEDDADPPTRGRGVAIGEEITRLRMQLGHAIPLEWDNTNRTRKAVGEYVSLPAGRS